MVFLAEDQLPCRSAGFFEASKELLKQSEYDSPCSGFCLKRLTDTFRRENQELLLEKMCRNRTMRSLWRGHNCALPVEPWPTFS